jgi:hypothetical protein
MKERMCTMPPKVLLTQKEAFDLVKQAAVDFPGLLVLLEPVTTPRPLTAQLMIDGFILIVAGPRGRSPWFEIASALAYDDLYERIYDHYGSEIDGAAASDAAADADDEEPLPVASVASLVALPGNKEHSAAAGAAPAESFVPST